MQFDKAYKLLLQGKKIRRKEWEPFMSMRLNGNSITTYRGEYTDFYKDANLLLTDGWLVIDGDDTEYNFISVIEQLKLRKKITNKNWIEAGEDSFLFINDNKFTKCTAIPYKFMPSYVDLIATDWEEMK